MWFAPKIATVIDVLTRPKLRHAFGGTARFLASVATETVFFILLSPIMWICHTLFLAGLPFGRVIGWIGQVRDDHTVPWSQSLHQLVAAHRARLGFARPDRRHPSGRIPLCVPAGRRPCAVDSARGRSPRDLRSAGCSPASASAGCPRKPRRRWRSRRWPCPRSPPPRARHSAMLRNLADRARGDAIARHLLRLAAARAPRAMDALYAPLRQARRSGVRHRRPCRRPRRRVSPARRQGGGGRAAAAHSPSLIGMLYRPRPLTSSSSASRSAAQPAR